MMDKTKTMIFTIKKRLCQNVKQVVNSIIQIPSPGMQMWGFLCQLNHMRSHKKRSSLCPSAHPLGLVKAEVSNALLVKTSVSAV